MLVGYGSADAMYEEKLHHALKKNKIIQKLNKEDLIKLGIAEYNRKTGEFELIYEKNKK